MKDATWHTWYLLIPFAVMFAVYFVYNQWKHHLYVKQLAAIKPGDQFYLQGRRTNPWEDHNVYAEVVEVKNGWVRYFEIKYPDEIKVTTIDKFMFVYRHRVEKPVG
jgi:hypothetical protein